MDGSNVSILSEFILKGLPWIHESQVPPFLLLTMIYMCTLLGNALLICAVIKTSSLHTPMYIFLTNLSFLDICLSSVIMPRLLGNVLSMKAISFSGCVSQMYFFHFFASSEAFLYTIMAYDRYVAICRPLHYNSLMSWRVCMCFALGAWLAGSLHSITHTVLTFHLPFCHSNEIDHFFCDIIPVLKLACADTSINKIWILINIASLSFSCFLLIMTSYINIILAIIKIRTVDGRKKAFSTCVSHLTVVALFYVPCALTYMRPDSKSPFDGGVAVFYTLITPFLNPMIYSLRNKEVKGAIKRLISH